MGIESLIPFGLEVESAQLVDVGSVKRGKACGCICPSCKTPLVARQGDAKEWHFAHHSQKVHSETQNQCEYSFAVSVRLMLRQLAVEGLKFRTPRLEKSLPAHNEYTNEQTDFGYLVTDECLLELADVKVGATFCGVTVDVLGYVEGVPFVVFVTSRNRTLPPELKNPSTPKCGVVALGINGVPGLFSQETGGQYKEVLRRHIENETLGKTWAYHPREQKLRAAALERRKAWLLQQDSAVKRKASTGHLLPGSAKPTTRPSIKRYKSVKQRIGNYTCVMCKSEWTGTSRICEKCNTHLFTTERE